MEINDKIYKEVAQELNMDIDLVAKIAKFQFEFIAEKFEEKKFQAVRLQYLGLFQCKPERLKKLGHEPQQEQ